MRKSYSPVTEQGGFSGCGYSAGYIDIRAQVTTVVDPGDYPVDVRREVGEAQAGTVGRSAVYTVPIFRLPVDAYRIVGGHLMSYAGLRRVRRRNDGSAQSLGQTG